MIRFLVREVVLGARAGTGAGSPEPSLGTTVGKNKQTKQNHQTYPRRLQDPTEGEAGQAPSLVARGSSSSRGRVGHLSLHPFTFEAQKRPAHFSAPVPHT